MVTGEDKTSVDSFDVDPWDEPSTSNTHQLTAIRVKQEAMKSQIETPMPDSVDSPAMSMQAERASPVEDFENELQITSPPAKRPQNRGFLQVKTFVFFDLETTGLILEPPSIEGSITERGQATASLERFIRETSLHSYPHITELAMVAVDRDILKSAMHRMSDKDHTLRNNGELKSRRVSLPCSVHSRLIKPILTEAEWIELEKKRKEKPFVFHIGRFEMERQRTFLDEWLGIRIFLQGLPKPACLVAHNGLKFDFPILFGELIRNHVINDAIPSEVYFLDSLLAFRSIDDAIYTEMRSLISALDWKMIFEQIPVQKAPAKQVQVTTARTTEDRDLFDESPQSASHTLAPVESYEMKTPERPPPTRNSLSEPSKLTARRSLFSPNAKAVQSPTSCSEANVEEVPVDHPLLYLNSEQWSPSKKNRELSKYFLKTSNGKWEFDKNAAMSDSRVRGSYKLENLYSKNIHDTYDAHSAEPDCHALAQVCLSYGEAFVNYADKMAATFPF
ncbi:unnamed protein product, partial [Mesorhabditis belari]|uniref:Three prime repair exonuclease n=1 Tax=Mesorhabditis belari TaxID=2138241 RepID=A0AAF3FQV8_9BILA